LVAGQQSSHRWLAISIAIIFSILASIYSVVTPIFESPDELWHYPFVWQLARSWELPVQDPANPQLWRQEGSQAPLYYALGALLTGYIPTDDLPELIYSNPQADIGLVSADGNANIVVHTELELWPWHGSVLAVHLVRFLSVLLGTGTVLIVYALGRVIWPERLSLALLAMSFVAFNPMFLFISGSVNNDNLIIFLVTLTLWWLVLMVVKYPPQSKDRQKMSAEPPLWGFAVLGVLVGLAALAKASGLILLGLVGLTLLGWGGRRRSWRIALLGNVVVGVLVVVISGWWYWRNLILYGDLTGTRNIVLMMGPRPFALTLGQLVAEMPGVLRSFWGLFGYFSVPMPAVLYWFYNLMLAGGLVGLLVPFLPGRRGTFPPRLQYTWFILAGWLLLTFIALIQWTLRTPASQGRFLFPAFGSLAIFWATGWLALVSSRWQMAPVPPMLAVALWVPWGVIGPAYARPAPVAALPDTAQSLEITFGEAVTLLGYDANISTVRPGESVPLTLYWRGKKPMDTNFTVFLHLLDENEVIVAQRNVFHGPGVYPTSQWTAGAQFGDTYVLNIPRTAYAPNQTQFEVGLYDHTTGNRLPIETGESSVRFGDIEIEPQSGQFPNPQALQFEDHITLIGYSLSPRRAIPGDQVTLTLYWQSEGIPNRDYKVFVHLVGEGELRIAQHDSDPQNGIAPTSNWSEGQVIVDNHPLQIAPETPVGVYHVVIGLYEGDTGRRLRLLKNGNAPVQADSVILGGVRIVTP
jgi:4-amino-4-deoxy-L-arabinose transferase-like glycosyltransferase